MAKSSKKSVAPVAAVATTAADAAAPQQDNTVFTVLPPKRSLTGVKYGISGNAKTHAALAEAAAANGGTLTATQAMAVCVAMQHKGFYTYAIKRLRVLQAVVAA
jgi:hypothetical protein